jgi:hypothetical protein
MPLDLNAVFTIPLVNAHATTVAVAALLLKLAVSPPRPIPTMMTSSGELGLLHKNSRFAEDPGRAVELSIKEFGSA